MNELFKAQIEASLNNALSNTGYSILDWDAMELARGMVTYDNGFEEHEPAVLVTFIAVWLGAERAKLRALQLAYPHIDIYGGDAP